MRADARAGGAGVIALLLGAVALAYANAFGGIFQFDDYKVIVDYPVVHSWQAWWEDFGRGLRPLLKLSYTLSWTMGLGEDGFHAFNVLVHAANTLLVFALVRPFAHAALADPHPAAAAWTAGFAALLFALHPMQTEAVTYICGRSVSLMAFFYLAALAAYVRAVRDDARGWHAASLALFVFALATKEVAATYPAALLLWEMTGNARRAAPRTLVVRQLPYWMILAALAAVMLLRSKYAEFFEVSLATRGPFENLVTQANGIVYLLGQWLWPAAMNIDPDLPALVTLTGPVAAKGLLLLALLLVGFACWRRVPWLAFGLLWFFLHLAPTNSVFPRLDVANDRQLYLPGVGLALVLAIGLQRAAGARAAPRALAVAACAAFVATLATLTVLRNRDYRSEIALWEQTVARSPGKARPFNNLGHAYRLQGCSAQAADAFRRSLELDPGYAIARRNYHELLQDYAYSPYRLARAPRCEPRARGGPSAS